MMRLIYFICYASAAGAVAVHLPAYMPVSEPLLSWLAGAVVFLTGALFHERAVRRRGEARDLHRMALLLRAHNDLREDVIRLSEAPPRTHRQTPQDPDRPQVGNAAPEPRDRASDAGAAMAVSAAKAAPSRGSPSRTGGGSIDDLRAALRQNKTALFLQPVATLPQRKCGLFRASARPLAGDGGALEAARYRAAARKGGLDATVENMLLFRTVQHLRQAARQMDWAGFICAISPNSIADRDFFPDFTAYLGGCRDLAANVIFEIPEAMFDAKRKSVARDIGILADAGFRLCAGEVDRIDPDVPALASRGVKFVSLDARLLMPAAANDIEANRVRLLKQALDRAGVDLIVTGIDSEAMLIELLDFNIDFGQGSLFGEALNLSDYDESPERRTAELPAPHANQA